MDANQLQEARKMAADKYDEDWPLRTTMGNLAREGFIAGWDAAMVHVEKQKQQGWSRCYICNTGYPNNVIHHCPELLTDED